MNGLPRIQRSPFDPVGVTQNVLMLKEQQRRNQLLEQGQEMTRGQQDFTNQQARQQKFIELLWEIAPKIKGPKAYQWARQFWSGMFPEFADKIPDDFETFLKVWKEAEDEYTLGPGQRRFRGKKEIAGVPAEEPKAAEPGWVEMTRKGRKTKVRENRVEEFEKKGWKRGVPLPEKAAPTGKTEAERNLDNLRASYEKAIGRYYAATRGVDEYIEVPRPQREKVAKEALKSANIIAGKYEKAGGDRADLGRAPLPEGLTEELIQFYIDKHGLTREEVIQRYTAKIGQ